MVLDNVQLVVVYAKIICVCVAGLVSKLGNITTSTEIVSVLSADLAMLKLLNDSRTTE